MSKKVLLLHGWGGSDFPHWQSWLACELAKDYGCVNFLRFSNADTPKLAVWMQELTSALDDFRPDIVVCHSLANTLWFHLCQTQRLNAVKKLYLVAPPSLECKIEELGEFFPVQAPKNLNAVNAMLITSTNDPYMSIEEAEVLQKKLRIEMKRLQKAGHINAESGYGQWEWMLKEIKKDLSL
jgi:predicted alpha/beta hydrolase family esterase